MTGDFPGGIIRWEEPPAQKRGREQAWPWALVAAQLRANPGRSALIAIGANPTLAVRINSGKSWWAPAGAFEATARMVDGQLHVWAKYVG